MYSEYPRKQKAISYYPISKNVADAILRKENGTRVDDEGQMFYIYDEIQIKTNKPLEEVEVAFDDLWNVEFKPKLSVEEKVLEHDEKVVTIEETIDVLFGGTV